MNPPMDEFAYLRQTRTCDKVFAESLKLVVALR